MSEPDAAGSGATGGLSSGPSDAAGASGGQNGLDPGSLTFDQALAELQRTVAELEQGGLPLERSIELYERGVALHERCAGLLGEAELRVQRLLERAAGELTVVEGRGEEEAD
jgi:exodeoxyribonuclease VII small subunit